MSDKNEKAMRLYEALEGVDPKLLERSEKKTAAKNKIIPFQRYVKAMAACVALVVVGTACWATLRNGGDQKSAKEDTVREQANYVADAGDAAATGSRWHDEAEGTSERDFATGVANGISDGLESQKNKGAMEEYADAEPQSDNALESAASSYEQLTIERDGTKNFKSYLKADFDWNEAFLDKRMEIAFGQEEPKQVTDQRVAYAVYEYLKTLNLARTEDQDFTDYVTIRILDLDGNATEAFCVSGDYLKLMGAMDTYVILDDAYDYAELMDGLFAITQEED